MSTPPAQGSHGAAAEPLLIVLLGPTASGKSELAIALAEALDLAVLSVDSRQVYQGMNIGTAKASPEQRRRVRHALLDLRPPDRPLTLEEFRRHALVEIDAEQRRRGAAFLVGGTGLYLKAISQGLQPPAVPPQPALRRQLSSLGQEGCHRLLGQGDPAAAERIAPADAVRTLRALEVLYATGLPLSSLQSRQPPPWRVLELGLNPADLRQRIERRSQELFAAGLVQETEGLIQRYGADLPLLHTIGYDEARRLLAGELSEPQAIGLTSQRTRRFAKRQRTWFRRQHTPIWLEGPEPLQQALPLIRQVLG